jgi:hypothetical protein
MTEVIAGPPSGTDTASSPGVREEKVMRLRNPFPNLPGFDPDRLVGDPELLLEGFETDVEAMWQMNALAWAAVQRIAHGQAEILTDTLSAAAAPLADSFRSARNEPPPIGNASAVIGIFAKGFFMSIAEIVRVASQCQTELNEINGERMQTWRTTLRQFLGIDGPASPPGTTA